MQDAVKRLSGVVLLAVLAGCGDEPMSYGPGGRDGAPELQATVVGSPRDRDAIAAIVEVFDATWALDASRYAAQYAGAEWVGPNGAILTDPAAIEGLYAFLFSGPMAGTARQSIIRNITFLTGTIAVLDIDTRVTGFAAPPPGTWQPGIARALERNILLKRAGEWRIILHQQTLVAPGV